MAGGNIVNTWVGSYARQSAAVSSGGNPGIIPVDVAVGNTAGNWLFAIITWDQSAVLTGIQFPTSVSVSDDAHNFWLPVTVVQPNTGVLRTALWMAPAARAASFVTTTQTAYQQVITVTILEVTATVPWYSIGATASTFTNAGTSITLSEPATSSLFSIGVIAYDNNTATVSFTSTGWLTWNTNAVTNGTDHTSDLTTTTFVATTSGSTLTLSASSATTMNWSEVIIAVQGVSNSLPIPFTEVIQNWPDIIVEMACGQVLNANQDFLTGVVTPWTPQNGATLSISQQYLLGNAPNSMVITPNGSSSGPGALSEQVTGIVPYAPYALNCWLTSPLGTAFQVQVGFNWYTSAGAFISSSGFTSAINATGSLQQLTSTAYAPATAGRAQMAIQMLGTPAATVLTYVAYASLGIPGGYSGTPLDQVTWIDVSNRAITQDSIKVSRGIQYENQTFEAGTLSLTLANSDGAVTPGNVLSPFYPLIGDIDVRMRVRAITPHSLTPYAVLFSGFTDDYSIEYHPETKYQYALVTCSDIWSRLTTQMVTAAQQEYFEDNPYALWPCNEAAGQPTAANIVVGTSNPGPLTVTISPSGLGTGVTQGFGSSGLSLLVGDAGATGWQVQGLGTGLQGNGASLTFFPANPRNLPSVVTGMTLHFWTSISGAGSINWNARIASCVSAVQVLWALTINNPTGANPGNVIFTVFDKVTNAGTATTVLTGNNWTSTFFTSIAFTTTTWTVNMATVSATGVISSFNFSGASNFNNAFDGFIFNGVNSEFGTGAGLCFGGTMQDMVLYPFVLPPPRVGAHFFVALTGTHGGSENLNTGAAAGASFGDTDVQRIGAIFRYSVSPPAALTMRGTGVPQVNTVLQSLPLGSGSDWMTAASDTNGQVASDYLTNIASSTAAALFVDGPGALNYRRRAEWYGLTAKWTMGEQVAVPLNLNPNFNNSVSSWTVANATFTFTPFSGQFGTNGGVAVANGAGAIIITSEDDSASQGNSYAGFASVNAPAGYTAGAFVTISFARADHSVISSVNSNTVPLPAGQWTYLITPASVAPAATAFIRVILSTSGTPTNGTIFNVDDISVQSAPGEIPYLISVKLTQDRAQLFNSSVVTQFGTQVATLFSGPEVRFQPTSGVVVITTNVPSATLRGVIPYVSTNYLANTYQNPAFFLPNTGAVEDFASWIVQTRAQPGLRAENVDITPVATPQAVQMGLLSEVGDTVVLNRRSLGSPLFSTITYISQIEHDIDIKSGKWDAAYQLTPNPNLQVLTTDNPALGVLDGINRFGW